MNTNKIFVVSKILTSLIVLSSCLEPSGEEGSAIGKVSQLNQAAGTDGAILFSDFSSTLITNCSTAGTCHSTGGGIPPLIESEEDLAVAYDTSTIPSRYVGPISLATMKGEVGVSPMPPSGIMQDSDPEFVAQFEAYINTYFDADGVPIDDTDTAGTETSAVESQ